MTQVAKSLVGLPWAASLFGAQQFANLLSEDGGRKVGTAFYSVTEAVEEQFGNSPVLFGINQLGDDLQRSVIDFAFDLLRLKPFDPNWLGHTASGVIQESLNAVRALTPGGNLSSTCDVLRNTFAVINLVNRAPTMLDLSPGEVRLQEAVDRSYAIGGDFAALWLIEGLGKEYANRNWSDSRPVSGLLTSGQGAALCKECLLMMHAGLGISFAGHIVRTLTPHSSASDIDAALTQFVSLVRANARPGYEGPAYESLGLVTRTWYPQVVPVIGPRLWSLDQEVLQYFWHGVGRAVYFDPRYLVPGATAFHGIQREAPHELGLLNGMAGAAWAFTLVNIRQPEIALNLLRVHSGILGTNDAFTNGLISTLLMASAVLPSDPNADRFCRYQPPAGDPGVVDAWDRWIGTPSERAMREYFSVLENRGLLGEVFRYQNLDELVNRLRGRT
jgi:hypothetical protein